MDCGLLGEISTSISKSCERKGSLFVNRSSKQREFKDFIEELNLVDLPCN